MSNFILMYLRGVIDLLNDSFRIRYKSVPVAISEQNHFLPTDIHNHNEFEILIIKSGSCTVRIGSEEYQTKENDLIFINPMEVHEVIVNTNQPYAHQCMCFDISVIMNNRISDNLKNECTSITHIIKGHTTHAVYLNDLFDKIFNEVRNDSKTSSMDITAYITLMFSYLLKNSLVNEKRANPEETKFCKDILAYISKSYQEKITSKSIAEELFLNHSYFCRKFKDNFGISFSSYLNIYRISVARAMLEEGIDNISKISEMCGFDTHAYFSKCFKNYVGVLPSEYKKGQKSS